MLRNTPAISSVLHTPKTGMEQFKEDLRITSGALMLTTVILAMSALDNNAHGAEKTIKASPVTTKSLKIEKKLPQIAEENEQIYEFLEGKITDKDTLLSIQKKLKTKLHMLSVNALYDDFLLDIHSEIVYRQKTSRPVGEILHRGLRQMQSEQAATRNLQDFFATLHTEDISKMNAAIITYYNTVGGNIWGEKELEQWKKELTRERTRLGYSYMDAMIGSMQYVKR